MQPLSRRTMYIWRRSVVPLSGYVVCKSLPWLRRTFVAVKRDATLSARRVWHLQQLSACFRSTREKKCESVRMRRAGADRAQSVWIVDAPAARRSQYRLEQQDARRMHVRRAIHMEASSTAVKVWRLLGHLLFAATSPRLPFVPADPSRNPACLTPCPCTLSWFGRRSWRGGLEIGFKVSGSHSYPLCPRCLTSNPPATHSRRHQVVGLEQRRALVQHLQRYDCSGQCRLQRLAFANSPASAHEANEAPRGRDLARCQPCRSKERRKFFQCLSSGFGAYAESQWLKLRALSFVPHELRSGGNDHSGVRQDLSLRTGLALLVNCRSCTASATFPLAACLRVLGWLDPRRALLLLTVGWSPKHVRDPGWSPTHTCSHATARTRGLTTAVLQKSCAFKILRSSLCTIDHASFRL
ncbi:hypothetical protein L1887_55338 [Cichorium endivia]|nr:hypothetical protein L1887_55338 [Cichorium endivia]